MKQNERIWFSTEHLKMCQLSINNQLIIIMNKYIIAYEIYTYILHYIIIYILYNIYIIVSTYNT